MTRPVGRARSRCRGTAKPTRTWALDKFAPGPVEGTSQYAGPPREEDSGLTQGPPSAGTLI